MANDFISQIVGFKFPYEFWQSWTYKSSTAQSPSQGYGRETSRRDENETEIIGGFWKNLSPWGIDLGAFSCDK